MLREEQGVVLLDCAFNKDVTEIVCHYDPFKCVFLTSLHGLNQLIIYG